jgi:hypothetical protein
MQAQRHPHVGRADVMRRSAEGSDEALGLVGRWLP